MNTCEPKRTANPSEKRQPAVLRDFIEKRLLAYAAAGTALALAPPASASVISQTIDEPFVDGMAEFTIPGTGAGFGFAGRWSFECEPWSPSCRSFVQGGYLNGPAAVGEGNVSLNPGLIGPSQPFNGIVFGRFNSNPSTYAAYGPCARGACGGSLGVRFQISGQTQYNYGWIQFSAYAPCAYAFVDISCGWDGEIYAYGYNTVPGEPIFAGQTGPSAPEPGTLGLLALGSLGLAFWRRRKAGVTP